MNLSMMTFQLMPLPRIVFAPGAVASLAMEVQALGRQNALIVTDKGIVAAGIAEQIIKILNDANIETLVFDGVDPNPDTGNVDAGAEMLREVKDAVVIAVGGGSSMDAAKAIALQGPNGGTTQEYQFGCDPATPANPIIDIPTTAGTGSETNMFAMITDKSVGRKLYVAHPSVQATVTILDPQLTLGLPPKVTGPCGMDVLTHAIEAYTAAGANPYSDGVAIQAVNMVANYLPAAYENGKEDLEARSQMILASNMAAIAFSSAGLGICHAVGHPLSARLGVAHGQSLATMLPGIMDFNMDVCEAKYAKVALAMGAGEHGASDADNSKAAIQAVADLRARVGTNVTLRELGCTAELVPQLVEDSLMELVMMTTPKPPMPEQVTEVYTTALAL